MSKIISGFEEKVFATQSGVVSMEFNISTSLTSGSFCDFGVYNEVGATCDGFYIWESELRDKKNHKTIFGVRKNEFNKVKLILSGDTTNYYVNDELLLVNSLPLSTRTQYSKISIYPEGCNVTADFTLSGTVPDYLFSGFNMNETYSGVGKVVNPSSLSVFRIYSGVSDSGLYSFVNDSSDIVGIKQFKLMRNYELSSVEESSDNITVRNFTIYSNFGIFNEGIPIETVFPIVQLVDFPPISPLSGVGTGGGILNWSNYKGQSVYGETTIPSKLTIRYSSGDTGINSFDQIFYCGARGLDTGVSYTNMTYKPEITGYELTFGTLTQSGINYEIGRNLTGNEILVNFNYSGYNTVVNFDVSCF